VHFALFRGIRDPNAITIMAISVPNDPLVPDHLPFPQGGTYGLVQVSPALAGLVSTFGLLELTILTEVRLH
jgi:hypothetical protein